MKCIFDTLCGIGIDGALQLVDMSHDIIRALDMKRKEQEASSELLECFLVLLMIAGRQKSIKNGRDFVGRL